MKDSKRIQLTIGSIVKKMERHALSFDHPLQRASEQWSKIMVGNLISDILQENPIPDLVFAEQIIHDAPITWGIDGKQRCTNIQLFLNNKYRISDKIDRYMIEYPVPVLDENGNICRDGDGVVIHKLHTCDIRKKRFKDLPKELQERFLDYGFYIVLYLDCSEDNIAYHIKRYNEGRQMSPAQKGMTRLGVHFANIVRNISSMSFFEDAIGDYKPSHFKNGVINRVIIESLMTSCYLNKWSKDYAAVCEYVKKHAKNEDFDMLRSYVDRLEECVTEEVGKMFNAKDSFLWFGLFSKFSKLGLEDNKFVEFMEEFKKGMSPKAEDMSGLCTTEINGISYSTLSENDSTKDKTIVQKRVEFLTELMCDYLGVEIPVESVSEDYDYISLDNESEDIQEFAQDFVSSETAIQSLMMTTENPYTNFDIETLKEMLNWYKINGNKSMLDDCRYYKSFLNDNGISDDDENIPLYIWGVKYIDSGNFEIDIDEWLSEFKDVAFKDVTSEFNSNSTIMLKQSGIIKNINDFINRKGS